MTPTAILILLLAAGLHAGWNFLGKQRAPTPASFFQANFAGTILIMIPVLAVWPQQFLRVPAAAWWLLLFSGIFQAIYFTGLGGAYAAGHLSIAYPLARSSPVIIVTVVSVFLGRGKEIGWGCVAGVVLVVAGCFFLPMKHFREFHFRNYWNRCCLLALLAAVGTAGYTIIDDQGLRLLRGVPDGGFTKISAALVFIVLEGWTTTAWLGLSILLQRRDRAELASAWRAQKVQSLLVGAGMFAAYGLVLISFGFVRNVSYAAAFRQVSILLGVMLGAVFLKEPLPPPRLTGAVVIFLGLVLIAVG